MKYTLGIDIGTTSICAVAADASGGIIACESCPNRAALPSEHGFERLQSVDIITKAVYELIDKVKNSLGMPAAIGVTGQMHGILYTDRNGNAVSPLYTWQHAGGARLYKNGKTYSEYVSEVTGYPTAPGYGAVTHFYNVQNGEVPDNAVFLCTVHSFIAMKLTGGRAPLLHASDAASLGVYDMKKADFDREKIGELFGKDGIFPQVTRKTECVGYTEGGVPVAVAIGDNQASFFGSVGNDSEKLLVNVGTGSQVSVIGELGVTEKGIECRPYVNGGYLLVGSSLCGGRAYAVLEKFFRDVANMCGANIKSAYPFMDKTVSERKNVNALCVSTLFDGTRYDPDVRGSITGISVDNFEPAAMMYGFMQGIADELYGLFRKTDGLIRRDTVKTVVGSGNGLRANPTLCKIIGETFGMPVTLSGVKEEAAVGAALLAAEMLL